jgi:hypothetical protein
MIYVRMPTKWKKDLEAIEETLAAETLYKFNLSHEFGGNYRDEITQAITPFVQRPGGNRLMVDARRGDIVIFKSFALAFANIMDLHLTLKTWSVRGVTAYFHDLGLTVSESEPGAFEFLSDLVTFEKEMAAWRCPISISRDLIWEFVGPMRERGLTDREIAHELNQKGIKGCIGQMWNQNNMRAFRNDYLQQKKKRQENDEPLPCAPEAKPAV